MGSNVIFQLSNGKVLLSYSDDVLAEKSTLWENLELLNERLPFVVEKLFDYVCECKNSRMLLTEAVQRLVCENPCQLTRPEVKYPYMIKELKEALYEQCIIKAK